MSEGDGTVTPITDATGKRRRRGDEVVPPERRSQATAHLPDDATRNEVRRAGKLTRAKRRTDVLTLATAGHTPDHIAATLSAKYESEGHGKITAKSVEGIIRKALIEWQERDEAAVESVRAMQLARLDDLLPAVYLEAKKGKLKALDRVLKLEQLRARIAGTEAPRRLELNAHLSLGLDPAEVEREEAAWRAAGGDDVIDVPDHDVEELPAGDGAAG